MKSLLNFRSLIRVVVIIVVMAFMASQATDTYAGGWMNRLVDQIREALQGDFDDIREEIANHTHEGGGGGGDGDCNCPGDILPAGGRTIAGPGKSRPDGFPGDVLVKGTGGSMDVCVTIVNVGTTVLRLDIGATSYTDIATNSTFSACNTLTDAKPVVRVAAPSNPSIGDFIYRVDIAP